MINFAVIGQGHIGKRHAEMIRRNTESNLVAVADILNKESLELSELNEKYYTDIDLMLSDNPEIDIVNICTPNGLHAEHAIKALDAGKHIVCEKPMALTKADCEAIIFKALQKNKKVFLFLKRGDNNFAVALNVK